MGKFKKMTFQELVTENKKQLLKDKAAIEKIEDKLEKRAQARLG